MHKMLSLLICCAFASLSLFSQGHVCGTTGDEVMHRLLKNKQALLNNPISPREIRYVPIKFHIVSKTDGTGGVPEAQVFDMLCTANADFADLEMQFYIKDGDFNYIQNDAIHTLILDSNHPQSTINPLILQNIMNSNRDFAALNVFMVRDIILDANNTGNVLGFYSNDRDWVVMLNNEVRGSSITLTHELGHFFSLPHPFNGWESDPYDPDRHGNPVQANAPGFGQTEKMDGSNCTIAGDRICDTPPDYNFAGISCNWTEEIQDPDGTIVNPEEKLTMGYFPCDKDDYFFTEMQKQLMIQDLADSQRDYLATDPNLVTTVLESNTELVFPANDEQLTYYQGLELEWTAIPGATQYLIEIDRLPTFVFQKQSFYVKDANFLELNNLEANKKYYWRVKPYNDYSTCQPFTLAKAFTTGESPTAVQDIDFVSKWVLSPNPLTADKDLNLAFAAEKAFDGNIRFFTLGGQAIGGGQQYSFKAGENRISIPVPSLQNGVYLLMLNTSEGVRTERVLISK
ncbi:MAG: T9SS type A sorting domain-containing protein [Saprospiraceae bacterium]|nr:T9SS type A sorting domain-containing protein [Saprospiraceae bacterium]